MPILRIDTQDKLKFMQKEGFNFDEYPKMFIYFEGQFYRARENARMIDQFLHLMNRIVDPVVSFKNEKQIKDFFDTSNV